MRKYSKETVLALSLIGAGVGYMLADKYNKFGKIGTLGFMVGGLALGFGIGNVITKSKTSDIEVSQTVQSADLPETPETETSIASSEAVS